MRDDHVHVSDEDLLLAADGEIDGRREAAVRRHLAACWSCRARSRALGEVIASFVQGHHRALDGQIPSGDGPRALLSARLAQARGTGAVRRPVWATGGMALALGVLTLLLISPTLPWTTASGELGAFHIPDAGLTPGSTVLLSRDRVCAERIETEPPVVSRTVALAIFSRYGISNPPPGAYELDYLIAPELGGSTDARNLWPQSYAGTWNAHLKDALEDHLYQLVCSGVVDLHAVQREIATDWIAAYRKYFRTDAPIQAHQAFRKDPPWR